MCRDRPGDDFGGLQSYLRLLQPNVQKVIEPIRLDDIEFTMRSVSSNVMHFLGWFVRGICKKIGFHCKCAFKGSQFISKS